MKPQSGLKFLLPHLSDVDLKVIERYVAEQVEIAVKRATPVTTEAVVAHYHLQKIKREAEGL